MFVPEGEDSKVRSRMQDEGLSILVANPTTKPENDLPANLNFLHASPEPPNLVIVPRWSINNRSSTKSLMARASVGIVDAGIVDFEETGTRDQRAHLRGMVNWWVRKTSERI